MDLYPLHPGAAQRPIASNPPAQDASARSMNEQAAPARSLAEQVASILKQDLLEVLRPGGAHHSAQNDALLRALAARVADLAPHAKETASQLKADLAPHAKENCSQLKAELAKMDKIANEAMRKLEKKRQDKHALKAEVEVWRARYKDLKAAHTANATSEEERAEIQEKLTIGGQAYRQLKELRPVMEALQADKASSGLTIARLQSEIAALKAGPAKADPSPRLRELELEVVAGKEKLRAATTDASAKAAKLLACKDMLARADQVLKTCAQLRSAQDEEPSEFGEALNETAANLAHFLQSLDKP